MERVKPELRKTVTDKIGKLISRAGTVESFAKSIGVSRDTVNNWTRGKSDIRLNDLVNIAQVYDCSVDSLLGLIPESNHSTDETIRLVSDYTGLSTEAVNTLHEHQEHGIQAQAKALDLLLTSREGKAVLGQIFLYLTRSYDSFSLPAGVPLEGVDTSETSKSVVLWEDGIPKEELTVENLSEMFMVNILHDLGILRDKIQEGRR